jgi:hypothetical protein
LFVDLNQSFSLQSAKIARHQLPNSADLCRQFAIVRWQGQGDAIPVAAANAFGFA